MTLYIAPLLLGAAALYAASFAGNFFPRRGGANALMLAAGFVLQTLALWKMVDAADSLPTASPQGLMELVGWLCAMISLAGAAFGIGALKKIPPAAAAIFTMLPACCPALASAASSGRAPSPSVVQLHALAAAVSYALMFAALAVSAVYMLKHRALKRKTAADSFGVPLQSLDKSARLLLAGAAAAMAVSVSLGAAGLWRADINPPMLVKISAGLCVFFVQAYIAANALIYKVGGTALAKLCLTLVAVALAAAAAIELRNVF